MTKSAKRQVLITTLLVVGLLIIDQIVKILIKTNMVLDESITVFPNWFFIRFIENEGAAFGFSFGGANGKLILSLFRLVACGVLIWYLSYLIRKKAPTGVVVGFAMILAGALGNIIDSAFYGMIFSESTFHSVATLFPDGGGYGTFLHGKVVDMLYFPIISSHYPTWFPWVGGEAFTFFSPIFNFADSYITIAVIYLIIFQYKYFK